MNTTAKTKHSKRAAFSLAEMMTVVAVIALLLSVATPNLLASYNRSRENALRSDLAVLRAAVNMFYQDTGAFPSALNDLAAATPPATGRARNGASANITPSDYRGPYLNPLPQDPVSRAPFTYFNSPSGNTTTGTVRSSATGNDSRGVPYANY